MTIGAWIGFAIIAFLIGFGALCGVLEFDGSPGTQIGIAVVAVILIVAILLGMLWYFNNTASGKRKMVDQRSELDNGIERIVTVYTADGEILAEYKGKIDIEGNDGGYVLFDFDGKRYMYYNCFVESIADIP